MSIVGFPVPNIVKKSVLEPYPYPLVPEPTSSVAPKRVGESFEGWKLLRVKEFNTAVFTCQITGYPVPNFK